MATLSTRPSTIDIYNNRIRELAAGAGGITLANDITVPDGVEQLHACIDNPLCGDQIETRIQVRNGRIIELGFEIRGCLLAEASAMTMYHLAIGETIQSLEQRISQLESYLDGKAPLPDTWAEALECFTPVQALPGRHDCLLLPFLSIQVARVPL